MRHHSASECWHSSPHTGGWLKDDVDSVGIRRSGVCRLQHQRILKPKLGQGVAVKSQRQSLPFQLRREPSLVCPRKRHGKLAHEISGLIGPVLEQVCAVRVNRKCQRGGQGRSDRRDNLLSADHLSDAGIRHVVRQVAEKVAVAGLQSGAQRRLVEAAHGVSSVRAACRRHQCVGV